MGFRSSIDGGKTKWWLGYGIPQDSSLESFDPPLRLRHWRSVWLCWFFLLGNGTSCPCSMDSMGWIIPRPKKWKKKRLVPDASSAALAPAWVCWVMWRLERLGRRRARASWLGDVQPSAGKVPWVWSLPRKTLGTELAQFFSSTTSWVALSILSIFFQGVPCFKASLWERWTCCCNTKSSMVLEYFHPNETQRTPPWMF